MLELIPPIRTTPRAVIIRDNYILLLRKGGDERGERYSLPGGAQELGESLHDALRRECLEEIDTEIQPGELIYVAEFFKIKDIQPPAQRHNVELLFLCEIPDKYTPHNGPHPDKHQLEVVWCHLDDIDQLIMHPGYLSDAIINIKNNTPIYLGTFDESTAPT